MDLSIIIVNYRSWGHLQTAFDALLPEFPFGEWEIIVVDNESDVDLFNEFKSKYPDISFTANPINSGYGFGANIGAARATGQQLLFMNPDVIANSDDIVRPAASGKGKGAQVRAQDTASAMIRVFLIKRYLGCDLS